MVHNPFVVTQTLTSNPLNIYCFLITSLIYICMFIQKMIFIIFIITFLGSELDTTLFAHLNRFNFFIDEIGYLIRRHNFWTNNFYLTLYEYFRTMLLTKYNSYIFTVASANKLKHFS